MKNKKNIIITAVITFVVTAILVSIVVGGGTAAFMSSLYSGNSKLDRIEKYIDFFYIYDYDKKKMTDAALAAYAAEVGDPYTAYINKEDFDQMKQSVQGDYVGIGVEVFVDKDNLITVMTAFDGSPAAESGIRSGDKIVKVEGIDVDKSNYNEAINMIKGEATKVTGKKVNLTIKRGEELIEMQVARAKVIAITASGKMIDDNIGYVRISDFADHTAEELEASLKKIKKQNAKGLVIDLRNNPGGTLESVLDVADMFLPEGKIITIKDKQGKEKVYNSDKDFLDLPICVLINGYSASAAEVLAGAISDHKRGTLIGEKSFGKGIVQTIFELGDGTAFKVTTATYYTPNGTCIHKQGITPDIEVSLDKEMENVHVTNIPYEKDYQLKRAVEELNLKIN